MRYNIFDMYTEQLKRQKTNTAFEMRTLNAQSDRDKVIEKLGSSIYASIDRLIDLKAQIMAASSKDLKSLILQLQKVHSEFMEKQKSLMEVEETSDKIERLKARVKQFLEVFTLDDIQKKVESIKQDRIRQSHKDIMERQEMIQIKRYQGESFKKKLLEEEALELEQIQRCMAVVKKLAIDTSQLVLGIGAKLNIASQSMKAARLKMKQARSELVETNKYEQDTGKLKIFLCGLVTIIIIVIFLLFRASSKN